MSERIIPSWETIKDFKQPLTEGEVCLINFLDENLKRDHTIENVSSLNEKNINEYDGWIIFVQPFLNGSRPDVIIFHPKIGIQIIEVKDWNLDNYLIDRNEGGKWDPMSQIVEELIR